MAISWQIDEGKMDKVTDFIFLGSKITADSDSSHEIKRCLLLGRNTVTNLDNVLKSRDITLPTKVHIVKAMVFPVVMYGCDNWIIKKAECGRSDAFELWCWRRLLFFFKKMNLFTLLEANYFTILWWSLEGSLDSNGVNPVHPEGNQSWIFTGRTDAETTILWPPDAKSQFTGKDPDAGKD